MLSVSAKKVKKNISCLCTFKRNKDPGAGLDHRNSLHIKLSSSGFLCVSADKLKGSREMLEWYVSYIMEMGTV
jgi:hypothetical protein